MVSCPNQIILWGLSDFTKQYIYYLKQLKIDILFIIDSSINSLEYENIEIISFEKYLKIQKIYIHIPIIITAKKRNGKDIYEYLNKLAKKLNIKNTILHPYFLRRFINFRLFYRSKKIKNVIIYGVSIHTENLINMIHTTNLKIKYIEPLSKEKLEQKELNEIYNNVLLSKKLSVLEQTPLLSKFYN